MINTINFIQIEWKTTLAWIKVTSCKEQDGHVAMPQIIKKVVSSRWGSNPQSFASKANAVTILPRELSH